MYSLLNRVYEGTFTANNILVGFRRAGVCPVDVSKTFNVSRPANASRNTQSLTIEQLEREFEKKREAFNDHILGRHAVIIDNGCVGTTHGCVMTFNND